MLEIISCDEASEGLLRDYWSVLDEADYYNYKKEAYKYKYKQIFEKYNLKNSIPQLEVTLKQIGYVLVNKCRTCPECENENKIFTRKELAEHLLRNNDHCEECENNQLKDRIVLEYGSLLPSLANFTDIFNNNYKNIFIYNYLDLLNSLSFLELIYLYEIYTGYNVNMFGKLKFFNFKRFLYVENFNKNDFLNKLINKKIFYHPFPYTEGEEDDESDELVFLNRVFGKNLVSEVLKDIYGSSGYDSMEIHPIVWVPKIIKVKDFCKLIINKIESYKLNLNDLSMISSFLLNHRLYEVLRLQKTIKYNTGFSFKLNNAVELQIEELCQNYNLKSIYGYLSDSVNVALYQLDYFDDEKRKFLKNVVYKNCIISNKRKVWTKASYLPKNYSKSHVILFLERFLDIDQLWEDSTVEEFIQMIFDKMRIKKLILD
ncbi:hypothetical protein [Acinetobacter sp. ANC 5378]|uniref:hypothetical protein n=1 Tax=Acinetobacter sp. ANC 5378 TaxID=2731249 RepID=UPI00148FA13C|nr:hypothetical protein [Acinetobacter sp. ANC 5378]NNG81327.1 hypothetical protein [Acinetobacter sp. ANC 5378]